MLAKSACVSAVSSVNLTLTVIQGKNIWRRAEILGEYRNSLSLFEEYLVANGEKPEDIAYRAYANPFYGWTILVANDIVNYYEQWPRSTQQLNEFVNDKYSNPGAIKHYVTCLLYTSPSPRDRQKSRMPSSA